MNMGKHALMICAVMALLCGCQAHGADVTAGDGSGINEHADTGRGGAHADAGGI